MSDDTSGAGRAPSMPLLEDAARRAARYLESLAERSVAPSTASVEGLAVLDEALPEGPTDPARVLALLDEAVSPATMAMAGPRFFGFVIGGALPATLAANWLAGAWDQNAALGKITPGVSRVEEVALGWLKEVLGLPDSTQGSFVTGATMANFTALAAARHRVLADAGWNVEAEGLFGAPSITVIVGEEAHPTLFKSLGLLGLGRGRVVRVPTDAQGRMRADRLPPIAGPTIVCLQAGNINSGAFDPFGEVCPVAREAGAWVHVDGAFGLWAKASPRLAPLATGMELADSWATDAHKWLNVPYDSGLAIVADPAPHRAALSLKASYLQRGDDEERAGMDWVPESSRRARVVPLYALIRALGRDGIADLVRRSCALARRMAARLSGQPGVAILNEVVLNQVLVQFSGATGANSDDTTRGVIERVQAEGTCWAGGAVWQGRQVMRISVSNWSTTEDDIDRSADAILNCHRDTLA